MATRRVGREATRYGNLINKWTVLAAVALAVLVVVMATAMPVGAQDSATINFAENGTGPVATFTATDPEGVTPITWPVPTNLSASDIDGIEDADDADNEDFMIDEDGMLKFDSPPDFENPGGAGDTPSNTYKVVVVASDQATDGMMGYHKVTVMVTNVNEPGKVTLATSTDNGTP